MTATKTITINGRTYNALTGLLISPPDSMPKKVVKPAKLSPAPAPATVRTAATAPRATAGSVHTGAQRSATLNRRFTKKPTTTPKVVNTRTHTGRHMDIAKSGSVSRFAAHPVTKPATPAQKAPTRQAASIDAPAQAHPSVQRALARYNARKQAAIQKPATSKQVKEASIAKALAAPKVTPKKTYTAPWYRRARVLLGIAFIIIAIIAGVYAVYRFIPSVSVGVAAAQAGIEASFPEYTPDGYGLSQPVTYSDGQVGLRFTSNSNASEYYTITQKRSSWDSTAVLDAVVKPKAGENYATTKERGLTIYTHTSDAYWVNGGILYSIEGNAPLSGDHLRRIATSL